MLKFTLKIWFAAVSFGMTTGFLAHSESFYDRHVFFDNSPADRCYYPSEGSVVAPSKLELIDGKCPVDPIHFISPPNSLRLKWKSAPGGDWRMRLRCRD